MIAKEFMDYTKTEICLHEKNYVLDRSTFHYDYLPVCRFGIIGFRYCFSPFFVNDKRKVKNEI